MDSQGIGTITNDDSAGCEIGETGDNTSVTEGGETDSYELVLTSKPNDSVTIWAAPDLQTNLGNGAGQPVSFTFASGDWNIPQVVTVTAVDDGLVEGSHSSTITHTSTSSDLHYEAMAINDVNVAIVDDDAYDILITETDGQTTVTEGVLTDTFDVVLMSQPSAKVHVNFVVDEQILLSDNSLTFTVSDWDQPQTVTVTAVDDTNIEGNHTSSISFTVQSNDANYSNLILSDVAISITDNDQFLIFLPFIMNR